MGLVQGVRDDDEGFVLGAKGGEELPRGVDAGDGIIGAVEEEDGVGEINGIARGADGAGGESPEHAGGHAMMDEVKIGHGHEEIEIAREAGGGHVGVLGEGGPNVDGDPSEGEFQPRGGEGEAQPRGGDDEAGGVRMVADGEVEGDLPAEAVAIEEDGPRGGAGERPDLVEIVDEEAVVADIAAASVRPAMAAEVPGEDAEAGGIEMLDHMGVAAGVLAHAVGEEDGTAGGAGSGVRGADEEPRTILGGVHPLADGGGWRGFHG